MPDMNHWDRAIRALSAQAIGDFYSWKPADGSLSSEAEISDLPGLKADQMQKQATRIWTVQHVSYTLLD